MYSEYIKVSAYREWNNRVRTCPLTMSVLRAAIVVVYAIVTRVEGVVDWYFKCVVEKQPMVVRPNSRPLAIDVVSYQ